MKLWDFEEKKCVKTFIENHAIWAVKFHETGQMMATASLDHITRLWDLPSEKCTSVLRFVRIVSVLYIGTTQGTLGFCESSGVEAKVFRALHSLFRSHSGSMGRSLGKKPCDVLWTYELLQPLLLCKRWSPHCIV